MRCELARIDVLLQSLDTSVDDGEHDARLRLPGLAGLSLTGHRVLLYPPAAEVVTANLFVCHRLQIGRDGLEHRKVLLQRLSIAVPVMPHHSVTAEDRM